MPRQTMIAVKLDKALKEAAQGTAAEFGLPLSTMIQAFLRQLVREKTFSVHLAPSPSPYLRKSIQKSEKEFAKKQQQTASLDDMFSALDA